MGAAGKSAGLASMPGARVSLGGVPLSPACRPERTRAPVVTLATPAFHHRRRALDYEVERP
jgi:hypothetical protein